MAAAETPCSEFMNWELETSSCYGLKQEKQLSAPHRRYYNFCRRKSFAAFVASKRIHPEEGASWSCCGQTFIEHSAVHKHVAQTHNAEVQQLTRTTYKQFLTQMEEKAETQRPSEPKAEPVDISAWIPQISHISEEQLKSGPGKVLLYYRYCQVEDPQAVCEWQKALCEKLHLTGKVRVAAEGINGTVGGTNMATDVYIDAMLSHPVFKMEKEDFKISDGSTECFTDLRVGVYKEIVPMGVDPDIISYKLAGVHLEPEEFHREVEAVLANGDSDTVLLDCRNFYESKIGRFSECLAPDIRKFSYFPDYVDRNLDLFRNKRVLMYCTGGVRCERGSAYLRSKDVCREVLQLKGGIHKYLERFPDGFYRGKLFVFDERFAISSNDDVISACRYCGRPWDRYQLCSTRFCCQLVLSCAPCRRNGRTACCPRCQAKGAGNPQPHREENPHPHRERNPQPPGEENPHPGVRNPQPPGEENPHPPGERNPQPPGERNPQPHREENPQPPGERNPQPPGEGNHREENPQPPGQENPQGENHREGNPQPPGEENPHPGVRNPQPHREENHREENPQTPGEENPQTPGEENPQPPGEGNPQPPGEGNHREENPQPTGEENHREENPQPPGEENPQPPGEENPQPTGEENHREENPQPPGEENPQPPGEENPQPTGEENPQPTGEENHREENPQPPGERNPQPTGVRNPQPTGERNPQPPGVRNPQPTGEENPQPPGEENPQPPGVRNPQPPGERNHREGNPQGGNHREECECTERRPRIPQDV